MDIMGKAAYLHGLADGLDIDTETKEGKLMQAMVEVIDELSATLYDLQIETDALNGELDEVAEQLIDIENVLEISDGYEDFDGNYYEVECPTCGEHISIDEDVLDTGKINCPNCNEDLEFDFNEDECKDPCCECHS